MSEEISRLLLAWYREHARSLPWRGLSDPYAIWVSEIMLQQTRVETVIPYFNRWMAALPDIPALARATQDQVLKLWEGLGYYSRALSMHKAARVLLEEHAGSLPPDHDALLSLPGIGPYTAAAIASIAFGLDHAVVDGNVKRVLARLLNYTSPVNTPEAETELRRVARGLLPSGSAGEFNQAMMDLGAVICTPRNPACARCPLNGVCCAFKNDLQSSLPVKKAKPPIPHYTVTAGILMDGGQVLIARRPPGSLLGGLWEFPGGKVEPGETRPQALARELQEELGITVLVGDEFGTYTHAYTHFRVTLHAYHVAAPGRAITPIQPSEVRWVSIAELETYPMGKIDRLISRDLARGTTQ